MATGGSERGTSIDGDFGASDVGAFVGEQEQHELCNFVGSAHALHRNKLQPAFVLFRRADIHR